MFCVICTVRAGRKDKNGFEAMSFAHGRAMREEGRWGRWTEFMGWNKVRRSTSFGGVLGGRGGRRAHRATRDAQATGRVGSHGSGKDYHGEQDVVRRMC